MSVSSEKSSVATPERHAPAFRRALLKLSGEALMGDREYGVDPKTVLSIAREVVAVRSGGTELAVVVGGGNFYRGMKAAAEGMDRATADYAGMLATLLNALALQDALERLGANTRVQSAITVSEVAEPYIRRARSQGHGHDGALALHGQQSRDPRLRAGRGQHPSGRCGRAGRHDHLHAEAGGPFMTEQRLFGGTVISTPKEQ